MIREEAVIHGFGEHRDGAVIGSVRGSPPRQGGAAFLAHMVARETVCVRRLGGSRKREQQFGRFLANPKVTTDKLIAGWSDRTVSAVAGRHVLAIQDTTEVKFPTKPGQRRGLGKIKKGNVHGVLVHSMIAIDASSGAWLGLAGGTVWTRRSQVKKPHRERGLADKESRRWLETAMQAKTTLAAAAMVTVVEDREGDIYPQWVKLPSEGFHLLVRASQNRRLDNGTALFDAARDFTAGGTRKIRLAPRDGHAARDAEVDIRFGTVVLRHPKNMLRCGLPPTVELRLVEVREPNPPPGAEPVCWRLLTTHQLPDAAAAWQIVDWYLERWTIEQLHRTMKRQGLRLEDSQVTTADRLLKLAAIATKAAAVTIQLVQARDGNTGQPASIAFADEEIETMRLLLPSLEGKTALQKNPHPPLNLAWAAWIIARLGSWNGYPKAKPPGPITFLRGLDDFSRIHLGRQLLLASAPLDVVRPLHDVRIP